MAKLTKDEFYKKYYPMVADSVKGTGLFPEMVIAQMAVESGWGGSGLTTKHNNFFGIKGEGVVMASDEEIDGKRESKNSSFRTYNSPEDSIKDYIKVLKTQGGGETYKKVFEAKTPEAQAEAMGQSPYATGSGYGSSIKSTITANKEKTQAMANNQGGKDVGPHREKSTKMFQKAQALKNKYGDDSEQYSSAMKDYYKHVRSYVKDNQEKKEAEYKKQIEDAETNEEWTKLDELVTAQKEFDKSKFDFSMDERMKKSKMEGFDKDSELFKTKKADIKQQFSEAYAEAAGDEEEQARLKSEMEAEVEQLQTAMKGELEVGGAIYPEEMDLRDPLSLEKMQPMLDAYNSVEDTPADDLFANENIREVPQPNAKGTGTSGGSSSSSSKSRSVETRPGKGDNKSGDIGKTSGKSPADLKKNLEDAQKSKDEFDAINQERYQFQASDPGTTDVLGNLIDVGKGALGMIGATEEIPKYQRGSMFNEAMGEAERMRTEGLSADELNYRNQQSETAYAYNVKNIRRGAGGSAGAYLGNVQSAAAGLYSDYGKTAAIDEGLRRENKANFQQMALQDEAINRTMFTDELQQAVATKEAGASLVQDSIKNIQERRDYQRQYGKDSPYFNYVESLRKETELSSDAMENANEDRVKKLGAEKQFAIDEAQKAYDEVGSLDPEKPVEEQTVDNPITETDSGANLVQDALDQAQAPNYEVDENGARITKVAQAVQSPEKVQAEKVIAENIDKAEPKKNKERYDFLKDASEYGEMGDDEIAELELLEEAKKNGWRLAKAKETAE